MEGISWDVSREISDFTFILQDFDPHTEIKTNMKTGTVHLVLLIRNRLKYLDSMHHTYLQDACIYLLHTQKT